MLGDCLLPSSSVSCFCLCFAYSLWTGSAVGWDVGEQERKPPTPGGESCRSAHGRAQRGHTSSGLPGLLKWISSLPDLPFLLAVPSSSLSGQ